MIDIESDIFEQLSLSLHSEFDDLSVYDNSTEASVSFPYVIIEEKDNVVLERTQTSDNVENHAEVIYEINVYSNKISGKKSECKIIFNFIDTQMASLGFTRIIVNPVPLPEDPTVYRLVARYRAIISTSKIIFRR